MLAEANSAEFWPIEAIDSLLIAGDAQFWCDGRAALVTKIVEYPGGAVCLESVAGAGRLEELRDTIAPDVERWAREQGLTHLKVIGRPGWTRALGWKLHQHVLIKELANGQ